MITVVTYFHERGFTLLEVLVAFAILALSLGVLMQVFATGLRTTVIAEEYTQAAMYAESILAAVGADEALSEGEEAGRINDIFSWRSTVQPYVSEDLEEEELRMDAYRVAVEVSWEGSGRGRSVVLETLRVVTPDILSGGAETTPSAVPNTPSSPNESQGNDHFN